MMGPFILITLEIYMKLILCNCTQLDITGTGIQAPIV